MSWLHLIGLALGLAMDAFAVSIAVGLTLHSGTKRHTFRLAFHFGLFQAMMPILGWLAGRQVAHHVAAIDHWVAFVLLSCVGGKMLLDARKETPGFEARDPTRGLMLVTLSVATSVDALAVGLSMAFIEVSVWLPAVVIGIVAGVLSAFGITTGARLGPRVGRWAAVVGGCVLLFIGLRILVAHTIG